MGVLLDNFNSTQSISSLSGANTSSFGSGTMGGGGSEMGLGFGLSALGSVLSIGSSIYGMSLQKSVAKSNANLVAAQGNYNSAVSEFNAAVARANAEAIRAVADLDIDRQKTAATRFKSGQIAGYSKAGVRLEGSPIEVMIDSAQQAKLDIAITDYNAKVGMAQAQSRATGYDKSAQVAKFNAETSGNLMKAEAAGNLNRSYANAGTSLLSTVSSYAR